MSTSMEAIIIRVPAVPVAQPRAKSTVFQGRSRVYDVTTIKSADGTRKPHPIVAFKATVRMAVAQAYQGPPLAGPLQCDLEFVFPRPGNMTWKTKPMPRVRHIKKPDRDNCDKSVMDALKGIVWVDDCQVCDGRIQKWIASGTEQPHVVITITELEPAGVSDE